MVEQESVKVYELAKELGLDSLVLLERLKSLDIKVKNHMSDLSASQVESAKTALRSGTTKKTAPAPIVKKRAPRAAASAPKESAPSAEKAKSPPSRATILRRRGGEDVPPPRSSAASTEAETEADSSLLGHQATPSNFDDTHQSEAATESQGATDPSPTALTPSAPAIPKISIIRSVAPERKSLLRVLETPKHDPNAPVAPKTIIRPKGPSPITPVRPNQVIKMTKEGLDRLAEEEAAKKRGAKDAVAPEDVKFADYKKRELVFMPKRKRLPIGKELKKTKLTTPAAHKRVVEIEGSITVQGLAQAMNVRVPEVIKKLMQMGQTATLLQTLDIDTATLIATEFKFEVKNATFKEDRILNAEDLESVKVEARPPVVTIMGHVDHGKTSLLDAIRESNVAAGEAGGITQHIGAYTIVKNGQQITFIDTPGHEAFSMMRSRGAAVTDIVILVVAADDGVMPQTREALSHARAAKVPIIVAMNKMDKPGANPEKIKQQLAELDLLAEDWGGQTMFMPVSAAKKTNLDQLLEGILLQAEMLDLKAPVDCLPQGAVLEARMEKGRGPVVTLLIKRGTLEAGQILISGLASCKVRALSNHLGKPVSSGTPGIAVEVLGFDPLPVAGDRFDGLKTEADAERVLAHRRDQQLAEKARSNTNKMSLEQLFARVETGQVKDLPVIVKADVFGSVEAIRDSLVKLSTDKVRVQVIHSAAGGVTESDILLASASNAIVIGFNVRPETKARQLAEAEHVDVRTYQIIYELLDDVKKAMGGLLDKKRVETFLGRAEVRQTFSVPKVGTIAGCGVIDGKILRSASVRLLRDSKIIFEGKLASLKRFKDDAREVASGYECGLGIENFNDLKVGDIVEAFQVDMVAQTLGEAEAS